MVLLHTVTMLVTHVDTAGAAETAPPTPSGHAGAAVTTILSGQAGAAVTMTPSGIIIACSGDHVELTCRTTGTLLQWQIRSVTNETSRIYTRTLSSLDATNQTTSLKINSSVFNFSRLSTQGTSPLLSRLVVSQVSDVLNGTEVKCEDETTAVSSTTAVIHVLLSDDIGKKILYSLECMN